MSKAREPITNASIYPHLKNWLKHYHNTLESIPNAAHHALCAELFTACFEYEVSSPKHEQTPTTVEWEEEDAERFALLYFSSLRLPEVLHFANLKQWTELIAELLDRHQKDYDTWKKGLISPHEDSSSTPEATTLPSSTTLTPSTSHLIKGANLAMFNDRLDIETLLERREFASALRRMMNKNDLSLILPFLKRVYSELPQETLQYCASLYPLLTPQNVLPIIASSSAIPSSSDASSTHYDVDSTHLEYLYYKTLVEKHADCRQDEEIVLRWMELALSTALKPYRSQLFTDISRSQVYFISLHKHEKFHDERCGSGDGERFSLVSIPTPRSTSVAQDNDTCNMVWLAIRDRESYAVDRKEVLKLCIRNGFWKAALSLLLEMELYEDALELAIAVDDKITFDRLLSVPGAIPAHSWPRIVQRSAFVLSFLHHQLQALESSKQSQAHGHEGDALSITPDVLLKLMSSIVGPSEAISVLNSSDILLSATPTPLPSSRILDQESSDGTTTSAICDESSLLEVEAMDAFISCISYGVMHQMLVDGMRGEKRREVVAKSMKSFDQNLWSKRTPFFGPQIANVEFIEKASAGSRENPLGDIPFFQRVETSLGTDWNPSFVVSSSSTASSSSATSSIVSSTSSPAVSSSTLSMTSTATPTFFGDFGNHWGVHTRFSQNTICGRCGLPLLDARAGKVALFENCSHAYHEMCTEEEACPECVLSSFTSLLPTSAHIPMSLSSTH